MESIKYQALLKTAELGSITRAAEALGYTQSAVSRMIAELEQSWDLPLLTRGRSGAVLTAEGELLLPYLREVRAAHGALDEQVGELHGLTRGTLRVGTLTSIAVHWLPELMKSFLERYPSIRFELLGSVEYAEIEEWVAQGRADCGFLSPPVRPGLELVPLRRDQLVAILPPDHPLAQADAYPIAAFAQDPYIRLTEGRDRELAGIFRRQGVTPNVAYTVDDDYAIIAMVESGLGVSMLHELVLRRTPYRVAIKPLDPPQFRDLALIARAGQSSPLVRRFIEHVRERSGGTSRSAPQSRKAT